jgi:hypothetical protein
MTDKIELLGFIVDVNCGNDPSRFKVRVLAHHGYCDLDEKNSDGDNFTKNAALPCASTLRSHMGQTGIIGNDNPRYKRGDFVSVLYENQNYTIVRTAPAPSAVFASKEKFAQEAVSSLLNTSVVSPVPVNKNQQSVASADNGCYKVITGSTYNQDNGTAVGNADKCGESGRIKDGFTANIADFLKIIQDTNGKIGSKFVSKYTGELFEITGHIQKYIAAITGIFRSAIGWIKAIITKYIKKAIDKLLKLILQPIKGITKALNTAIESALQKIACSFGDIEKMITNMLSSLFDSLIDTAINAVFGCLDSLVDGILNEILNEVMALMNSIISSISAIAGIIGGFGDLIGEAIAAVLDFLGIKCGGAGDCTVSGEKSFINKFNSPGEYGFPSGLKKTLNAGLTGLQSISSGIDLASAQAANYTVGTELGVTSASSRNIDNPTLARAFNTANGLLNSNVASTIDGFCNSLTNPTAAVVFGSRQDKYDAVYRILATSSSVPTGSTQSFEISRNNGLGAGVINFVAYLKSGDTARVVGITPGLSSGGDLDRDITLNTTDFCSDPNTLDRTLPIAGNIIVSKKIIFPVGVTKITVSVPSKVNAPIDSLTDNVTYTVGIFRSTDDLNTVQYPGANLASTSSNLNTEQGQITFALPAVIINPDVAPPSLGVSYGNIIYNSSDISIVAGNSAEFIITRAPTDTEYSRIKCETYPINAVDGVNYSGGQGLIEFLPDQSSAIFAVRTTAIPGLTNTVLQFGVKITDETVPDGMTTNLGGTGYSSSTSAGNGLKFIATINYGLVPASNTTPSGQTTTTPSGILSPIVSTCLPEIIITSQPPSCIVQPDKIPLNLGLIAKTTVPGYTLNYQWQRTYSPSSGWTNVLNGLYTTTVLKKVTSYGLINTFVVSGVTYTLSGWTTSPVSTTTSTTFSGATSPTLTINPLSYLINDEEYYRCVISGVPITVTSGSPMISAISDQSYIGVTSSGVFLTTVECSPVAASGTTVIVYSGTTPTSTGIPVVPSGSYCVATTLIIPQTPSGVTTTPSGTTSSGTTSSGTTTPTVPSGISIDPVPAPDLDDVFIIIPVVDPDGGISSVPIPDDLPQYKYPPLIPISGDGFGAVARAELDENGYLIKIIVKAKGSGYAPTVNTGLCGILESIELITPGGYYETSPKVYVNDDDTIASAAIDENGRVVEIRVTNPQGKVFDRIPRIDIIGTDGFGASAIAVLKHVDCATVNDEYLNVVNKYNTSKLGTVRVVDCP